jgi:hypothetical protein
MNRVCAAKAVLAGQVPGSSFYRRGQFDGADRGPVPLPGVFRRSELVVVQVVIADGGRQCGANLRVRQPARQRRIAPVPQLDGELSAGFADHKLYQGAGVEIDEGHRQRRWSLTMSDTGRRARGRSRPAAVGRRADTSRPITPSAASRCKVAVADMPSSRATGTPRSVTTTSSPSRTRSSQSLRCARSSVTGTSIPEVYIPGFVLLYGRAPRYDWSMRVQGVGGLSSRGSQSSGWRPSKRAWKPGSHGKRLFLSAHTTCRYGGLTKP